MLVLFYFVTYGSTRSPYSGWWCVALGLFLAGSAAYLFKGTAHQWWANPVANMLTLAGAASVWGARSLRDLKLGWLQFAPIPVAVGVRSFADNPGTNVWSGGPVFLPGMSVLIGMASYTVQSAGAAMVILAVAWQASTRHPDTKRSRVPSKGKDRDVCPFARRTDETLHARVCVAL